MADLPNCRGAVIKGGGLGKKCSRLVERDHMVKGVIFVKAIPKYTTCYKFLFTFSFKAFYMPQLG